MRDNMLRSIPWAGVLCHVNIRPSSADLAKALDGFKTG